MSELKHEAVEFKSVLASELKLLGGLRTQKFEVKSTENPYKLAHLARLSGLAFSGGGIRSATFNLGVIQALSRKGLLSKFDYLSTVSGGGYIGGWLSALLHRKTEKNGVAQVDEHRVHELEPMLKTHPDETGFRAPDDTTGFRPVEHAAVRFLRGYSNYLTPRLGLSGDLLAVISIFLRNFLLLQLGLVTLVASVLLTAHVVAALSGLLPDLLGWERLFGGGLLMLIVSLLFAGRLLARHDLSQDTAGNAAWRVFLRVVLPCTLAAWWFVTGYAKWPRDLSLSNREFLSNLTTWIGSVGGKSIDPTMLEVLFWVFAGILAYVAAWGLGFMATYFSRTDRTVDVTEPGGRRGFWIHIVAAALSGGLLGLLLFAAARYVGNNVPATGGLDMWHAVGFGTPLFLFGLSVVVTVHIGLAGRHFREFDREWWARLGGLVLLALGSWAFVFLLVLYAPPLVEWLATGGLVAIITWAVGSGVGAWFAKNPISDDPRKDKRWKEALIHIAPWLFIGGLGVILAYAAHSMLLAIAGNDPGWEKGMSLTAAIGAAVADLRGLPLEKIVYTWVGALILFVLVCARLDINLFSMHTLYRNRLVRAYLGASRAGQRNPNGFTGFDRKDDLKFDSLGTQRPIPIINTSINMTGGDDLAWQTRRSASFTFTPAWAGFEARSTQGARLGGYRPTAKYAGGLSLGTLVAVSGAAASPNMGYHTSTAVAALLTAFNLRLGRWCGNPKTIQDGSDVWWRTSPRFAAGPIIAELTGSATAQAAWINLTDGGHFDNLGIYELVRRRCRLIMVTDAGCDGKYHLADLANAIRKCWTDFAVDIQFDDLSPLHPEKDSRFCKSSYAIGRICYPKLKKEDKAGEYGAIIYLKSSLIGNERPDIRQYADAHTDFPHETTADQFFDEEQFEAYRHLGFDIATRAVEELFGNTVDVDVMADRIVTEMAQKLAPNRTRLEEWSR